MAVAARRVRVVAAAAALASLAVAGCDLTPVDTPGANQPSAAPSDFASPTPAEGPVTLRLLVYGDAGDVSSYVELGKAFTADHPRVRVRVQAAADASATSSALLDAAGEVQGGAASAEGPDVVLTDSVHLPALVDRLAVQPLDQLLEQRGVDFGDSYQRTALEAFSAETALQCMPSDISPVVVYYNRDLLRLRRLGGVSPRAEDGWSFDQFAATARASSRRGVNGVQVSPSVEAFAPFIWSAGGDIADDSRTPTTLTLSEGNAPEAMEQVLELLRQPRVTPTQTQLEQSDAVERFQQGSLAMMLGTRALVPRLRATAGLRFDVLPVPHLGRPRTISTVTGYCLSAASPHAWEAAAFIAFAVGRQGATITSARGSQVPTNLAVAHSPAFLQPGLPPEHAQVFVSSLQDTMLTPVGATWPEVVSATQPYFERLLYAPVIDLDALLPAVDALSAELLAPPATDSPTPAGDDN